MDNYIEEYCARIRRAGAGSVISKPVVVERNASYIMSYVPFEHTNPHARLAVVSTTPGHTHVKLAARLTESLLHAHSPGRTIQRENKRQVELGGPLVRPNLIRMLDHFGIPRLIGVEAARSLWDEDFAQLQPLALLPHATTRRGLAFDGTLDDLLREPMLRHAFETQFLPGLARLPQDALCLGLGRTAWAGLCYAAERGVVSRKQLLGMMPVPARAGSMVRYFLGEVAAHDLSKNDPVRHRTAWLDEARDALAARVGALPGAAHPDAPGPAVDSMLA